MIKIHSSKGTLNLVTAALTDIPYVLRANSLSSKAPTLVHSSSAKEAGKYRKISICCSCRQVQRVCAMEFTEVKPAPCLYT
jgi:hypothetical protein